MAGEKWAGNPEFYQNISSDIVGQQQELMNQYLYRQMQQQTGVPQEYMLQVLSQNYREEPSGEKTLILIKKSIKQIKAEAVSKEAQELVTSKIDRLQKLGVTTQAEILKQELQLRIKLARIQEWDYKVLPYDAIKEYDGKVVNTYTLKVHIDTLDKYCGTKEQEEAKDRIMPDFVLDELEKAKDRQIFEEFNILWIEKVKDPLLLGGIKGCKDFFLICEWGEDIKFDDMIKQVKEKKE